jgi:hypothetical protein
MIDMPEVQPKGIPPLCPDCGGACIDSTGDPCQTCEGWGMVLIEDSQPTETEAEEEPLPDVPDLDDPLPDPFGPVVAKGTITLAPLDPSPGDVLDHPSDIRWG